MQKIILTKQDIRNTFDNATYQRGYKYYTQGKVSHFKSTDNHDFIEIVSRVQGSRLYQQEIDISLYRNKIHFDAYCSCPVGYRCKHLVASLFYGLNEGQINLSEEVKVSNNIDAWIDNFQELNTKVENKNSLVLENYFLIYRLFMDKNEDNQLNFYKAKILKNGILSKGTKLLNQNYLYHFDDNYKYNYLNDRDKALANNLKNISSDYQRHILFQGEYGYFLFKELLATGRCFYKESTVALHMIEESKLLSFEWVEEDGLSWMRANLKETEQLLYHVIPALCIDSQTNEVREIESSYNKESIKFLLEAPKFPSDLVHNIVQNVLEKMPEIDFPIPKSFEIVEYCVKPINVLKLFSIKHNTRNIHSMQLSFLYGDVSFKSNAIASHNIVTQKDKTLKIIRDSPAEIQSKEVIEALGFVYENNPLLEGYISLANPSMHEAIERWRIFREDLIPTLRDEGWIIEIDESFKYNFEHVETISLESHDSHSNNWFELSFAVDIGHQKLALLPIVAPLLEEFDTVDDLPEKLNLALEDGGFLHINAKEIKPILSTIFELFDKKVGDKLVIKPFDAHLLDPDADIEWKGLKELRALAKKLKNFQGIEHIEASPNLNATLRDYQSFGLDWLNFLHEFKFGGILADDMGLGKTIQTLAFLQILKERGALNKPTLIVMPTSLIGNWKNEIAKFTANLSFLELYGIDRADKFASISKYDIILTTYSLAQRDEEKYLKEQFYYIVLDEAQKIKNPNTKLAVAIKSFNSEHKLALSGTPIENHLGELWSIFDFLMNGFLDNLKTFKSFFQMPIEKDYDMTKRALLNKKIAPFILRRIKDEVVHELPPKTEIIKRASFDAKQAKLYENIRVTMESKVRETIKGKGLSRSHITILDALLKLRQVCCSPELLKLESAKKVKSSAKLEMFLELIESLYEEKKKVLVFSQFTSMLSIMEREIKKRKYTYTKLTGSTRKREEAIEKFTKGDANIFLISLKAGGVGLNLVEADTVIHYDPWWNPAVENQATDRAYRIGQDKAVFVYKLIVEGSIEEKILQLQERKKSLQAGIYKGNEDKQDKFDGAELVALLNI